MNCREMSIIGNYPLQFLDNFNIEICFIGVGGISIDHGLTDYTVEEIEIKKQMIQRSKVKIILADHTKFDRATPIKICDLSKIDKIITSDEIEEKIKQKYEDYGIVIIVVKTNKDE